MAYLFKHASILYLWKKKGYRVSNLLTNFSNIFNFEVAIFNYFSVVS